MLDQRADLAVTMHPAKTQLAMQHPVSIVLNMATHIDALLNLPKNERLEVAEILWLSVADDKALPAFAEHERIIGKRLERYQSGKNKPIPHTEMMKRLRKK